MLHISAPYPRNIIKTPKQYRNLIKEWNGKKNLFRSVYHFNKFDFSDIIINQVYFDFDDHDGTYTGMYDDVLSFIKKLKADNVKFRINFSGRGFHVYVGSEHCNMDRKIYLRMLYDHIIEQYGLTNVDTATFGNIKQLRRIENTINIKSNLYCIPITYQEMLFLNLDEIRELAEKPRSFDICWIDGNEIKLDNVNLSNNINENHIIEHGDGEFKEINDILPEPCIVRILHLVHPNQKERFLLCLWLSSKFRENKDINDFDLNKLSERIITFMRGLNWDDYSEVPNINKSTRYQVLNIINKKYNWIPSCENRRLHHICNSDYCWEEKNKNRKNHDTIF